MSEVWKPIPGFSSYEASNFARIRRVGGRSRRGHWVPGHVLSQVTGSHRYRVVSVVRDGGRSMAQTVHRLVALAFHGVPVPPRDHVAHGGGGRLDNRPENLRWATRSENMRDSVRAGTFPAGLRHGNAKLNPSIVEEIRARYIRGAVRQADLAAEFGVSKALVSLVVTGRTWR